MVYKPPQKIPNYYNIGFVNKHKPSIFLGGTIDMGSSLNWQEDFTTKLVKEFKNTIDIFNPRRNEWDASWEQTINNPQFKEQVTWELDCLEKCDYIVMNLLPESKSPISLLEIGLHVFSDKLLICCPEGFYRKGNIDIVLEYYDKLPAYNSMEEVFNKLIKLIKK